MTNCELSIPQLFGMYISHCSSVFCFSVPERLLLKRSFSQCDQINSLTLVFQASNDSPNLAIGCLNMSPSRGQIWTSNLQVAAGNPYSCTVLAKGCRWETKSTDNVGLEAQWRTWKSMFMGPNQKWMAAIPTMRPWKHLWKAWEARFDPATWGSLFLHPWVLSLSRMKLGCRQQRGQAGPRAVRLGLTGYSTVIGWSPKPSGKGSLLRAGFEPAT